MQFCEQHRHLCWVHRGKCILYVNTFDIIATKWVVGRTVRSNCSVLYRHIVWMFLCTDTLGCFIRGHQEMLTTADIWSTENCRVIASSEFAVLCVCVRSFFSLKKFYCIQWAERLNADYWYFCKSCWPIKGVHYYSNGVRKFYSEIAYITSAYYRQPSGENIFLFFFCCCRSFLVLHLRNWTKKITVSLKDPRLTGQSEQRQPSSRSTGNDYKVEWMTEQFSQCFVCNHT